MNAHTSLAEMKSPAPREMNMPAVAPGFGSLQSFELMQRAAKLLSSSTLVPAAYRNFTEKKLQGGGFEYIENPNALANCVVALNMSQRMGADALMVMQNLYIVEGRPSWSSQWIIAAINGCGRFSPLRFDLKDLGMKEVEYTTSKWVKNSYGKNEKVETANKAKVQNLECIAWAIEKETGARIDSPKVSIEMAIKEGWYGKNGSKWQTMPEVMLRYRTASFFGKLYAPELLMGLQSAEEVHDIIDMNHDGTVASVTTETLRNIPREVRPAAAEVVQAEQPAATAAPAQAVDQETDEIQNTATAQAPTATAAPPWEPTAEEIAEIHARELAEASGQQQPAQQPRARRERATTGGME